MNLLASLFKPLDHAAVAKAQLNEAARLELEHLAAAEHHQALATMYAQRAQRLAAVLVGDKHA